MTVLLLMVHGSTIYGGARLCTHDLHQWGARAISELTTLCMCCNRARGWPYGQFEAIPSSYLLHLPTFTSAAVEKIACRAESTQPVLSQNNLNDGRCAVASDCPSKPKFRLCGS
eukprot:675213-Amphidinium_carterae.1